MSKKKKKPRSSSARQRQKPVAVHALPGEGLKAFQRGDYDRALVMWEEAATKLSRSTLGAAMAEAYFRRGVRRGDADDLRRAIGLQGSDGRLFYYLGVVEQRNGRLAEAEAAFTKGWELGGEFGKRCAFPLACLAWRQGKEGQTAVWSQLTAIQQAQLQQAGVFLRRPYVVGEGDGVLWRGLAAYDNGRLAEAAHLLTQAAKLPGAAGISYFYLGAIAAAREEWLTAVSHWQEAYSAGFRSPRLVGNLQEAAHRVAEDWLKAGEFEQAAAVATEAYNYQQSDQQFNALLSYLEQQMGYRAAGRGDWDVAQTWWRKSQAHGGSDFRLTCNLALAEERAEAFHEAALMWREALRRRPRRDDHPDAISHEQVSRLWQRTAEAYEKAEMFDEALDVRKLAVKWQPESLPVRIELAEALLQNGRFQAAQNELERVLERDKNYVPALQLMGDVVAENERWWQASQAVHFWRRALELEPHNQVVRDSLANYYVNQAEDRHFWGNTREALVSLQQALIYVPKNAKVLSKVGACLLELGEREEAEQFFAQALEIDLRDLEVRAFIIICYVEADDEAEAWRRANQAEESMGVIPALFYIKVGGYCLANGRPAWAQKWLDKAEAVATKDEPVLVTIGELVLMIPSAAAICEPYLHRAIQAGQEPGQANLVLGILAVKRGDQKAADKYWREARKIARRDKDEALLNAIEQAEMIYRSPLGGLFSRILGGNLDPRLLEQMLPDLLGGAFEEDEDDDEFFS